MPFTDPASIRGGGSRQRGAALVEALVASAILGIVGLVGVTGWDAATRAAQKGVRQAWARCVVRSEADAILAAPWSDQGYPSSDPSLVQVSVQPRPGRPTGGPGAEEQVLVQAFDPTGAGLLFQVTVLKVNALQGAKAMDGTVVGPTGDATVGCPDPRPSVTR
ncbi:MAG TPA: type II secretion system protein [Candidatus Dormibacteraeota bacterium]|nr:type II secretion system protein [Candidatus Dormibacteraeota bacterium]